MSLHFFPAMPLLAAMACSCSSSGVESKVTQDISKQKESGKVTKDMVITNEPLTVEIELSDALLKELKTALASDDQSIRLTMRKLVPPIEPAVSGFGVFIDKPNAKITTSPDDVRYLGTVSFYPKSTAGTPKVETHVFTVKAALANAKIDLTDRNTLTFTFIPLAENGAAPSSTKIPFGELELSVVPVKK